MLIIRDSQGMGFYIITTEWDLQPDNKGEPLKRYEYDQMKKDAFKNKKVQCNVSSNLECGPLYGYKSCPLPKQYCAEFGQCGATIYHEQNAQSDFNYKEECVCNISDDLRCGPLFGYKICPYPGLVCSEFGQCVKSDKN